MRRLAPAALALALAGTAAPASATLPCERLGNRVLYGICQAVDPAEPEICSAILQVCVDPEICSYILQICLR